MKPMKNLLLMGLLSALGAAWGAGHRALALYALYHSRRRHPQGRQQGVSFRRDPRAGATPH